MIAIIDYGVGNIKAFANVYHNSGIPFKIVKTNKEIDLDITKIILPGVGSFDHAMESLENSGMRDSLDTLVLQEKIPVIGICIGMHMLAHSSEEGNIPGLGWLDGEVKRFDDAQLEAKNPLPHMGWNNINTVTDSLLFQGLDQDQRFYFLHSYYFDCTGNVNTLATASYGKEFACVVNSENVYGIQCHPEKSHHNGIRLLNNFGEM